MKRSFAYLVVFLPLIVLLVPESASAAFWGPIIDGRCKCENSAPDWGCVIQAVQNVMNLAVSLGVVVATLVIAYAGAIWMVSPVNPQGREMGRTMLLNAVIGLVVLLAGWIFVDFLMKQLYNENANSNGVQLGGWNEILAPSATQDDLCIERRSEFGETGQTPSGGVGTTPTTGGTPGQTAPPSCTVSDSKSECGGFYIQTACGASHNANVQELVNAGVRGSSSGSCCMKNSSSCTSLDGLSSGAKSLILAMQHDYGGVVISGGTETGHQTHFDGRRFDMGGFSSQGDAAIRALPAASCDQIVSHLCPSSGNCKNTSGVYWSSRVSNTSYYNEGNHWHVTVGVPVTSHPQCH